MEVESLKNAKNLKGKRVLLRVDFNVPVDKGKILDDTRIKIAIPSIEYLVNKNAKVIILSHFGRPKSADHGNDELVMVKKHLEKLIKRKISILNKWDFELIGKHVKKMKAGDIIMLPNTRLHKGEEKNDESFGKELADLGQVYVNEAFSVSHRAHASLARTPLLLPSYAGFHLEKEMNVLSEILNNPRKPFSVMVGGSKVSDKLVFVKSLSKKVDSILIGSSPAAHLFKAMGFGVGDSVIDSKAGVISKSLLKNKRIVLPKDLIIGNLKNPNGEVKIVEIDKKPFSICSKPNAILDIGPKTILEFSRYIKSSKTLLWAGPMGYYEIKRFSHGTMSLARLFASRAKGKAFGIVGGGETVDAIRETGLEEYIDWISTGGSALLEFLSGKELPAIEVLKK